jgi:DNA-binding transcriptional ArsR family regulator
MLRIHFTAEDLTRVRLRPTLGPAAETIFALGLLSRTSGPVQARWRNELSRHLRQRSQLCRSLSSPQQRLRAPGDLLCLIDRSGSVDDGALRRAGLTRHEAATGVTEFWRAAVEPHWRRIETKLTAECEARGRISMTGGVDQLFSTLHSRVAWHAPVLEIPGPSRDVFLDGRGLFLVPSLFLANPAAILIGAEPHTDQRALVYAVSPNRPQASAVLSESGDHAQALSALVGRTRAAALRALLSARTTTQLAEQLGISSAGASQHTTVLRESGLITTLRNRNNVLHTVTPLGRELLGVPHTG